MILGRLFLALWGAEAQRTVRSHRCPGPDWQLLLDPGTHCYKKLPHGYPRSVIELQVGVHSQALRKVSSRNSGKKCKKHARHARPVLPMNDRENELVVDLMEGAKGIWIDAKRNGTNINRTRSSSRLPYNRMSAQTRRLISRPKNESGSEIDC